MAAMVDTTWRMTGLALVAALALSGCDQTAPQEAPPPPTATTEAPPPAPDLAGGPPPAEQPYAPPPGPAYQGPAYQGMAPIPNPEDLPPDERARIYGHRYDQAEGYGQAPVGEAPQGYRPHHHRYHRLLAAAGAGAAGWAVVHHYHHHHVVTAPGAIHVAQTRSERAGLRPAAPAPASAPAAASAPPNATHLSAADRLSQLQGALAGAVAAQSSLSVADDLAAGKPGPVTLSIPAQVIDQLHAQARNLDLSEAASRLDVRAVLSGDGYVITPATSQSAKPVPGQPVTFTWQVQPQPGATPGMLQVQAAAELRGAGALKTLPLLSLEKPVTTPAAAAPARQEGPLESLNDKLGSLDVPGLGKLPGISLLAMLLLILVAVALVAAAHRHSAERERERRRRAREAAAAAFDDQVRAARGYGAYPPATPPAPPPRTTEPV